MARNNLKTVLEQVKITPNQLAAWCTLSKVTVAMVVMKKRTPAPSTQERMVRVINKCGKANYSLEEVFPPKLRGLERHLQRAAGRAARAAAKKAKEEAENAARAERIAKKAAAKQAQ